MVNVLFSLLAAGSFSALVAGAPVADGFVTRYRPLQSGESAPSRTPALHQEINRATHTYQTYTGSGAESTWPDQNAWLSFDDLFTSNVDGLKKSCTQWNVPNNSDDEISAIRSAVEKVAAETGVDSRFIFAVMMQESNGCVRAPTTAYSHRNPGLMQSHAGAGTCNEGGNVQTPCPSQTIEQMIREGVAGTSSGDGLKQLLEKATGDGAAKYYRAARMYNSGSIAASGDLGDGIATHCYCTDVANRLTGWAAGVTGCTLDSGGVAPAPAPESYAPPPPPPTYESKPQIQAEMPAGPQSGPAGGVTKATADNLAPGASTNCAQYYAVQSGDFCYSVAQKFGIALEDFRKLNMQLDEGCSNLWMGYDYCVEGL